MKDKTILTVLAAMAVTAVSAVPMGSKGGSPDFGFGDMKMDPFGGFKMGGPAGVEKYDGKPKAVLKEMRLLPKLGKDVPDAAAMMNRMKGRDGGFEARYLILAKGVVSVDYDGIVVDSIKDSSGKNHVKGADGADSWMCDSVFGTVNREAGFAEFVIRGSGSIWGKELPKIKGKVTITAADKMKTREVPGKITDGKIGSYKVKVEKSFMGDEKQLAVTVGPEDEGGELSVFCDGSELDGRGTMTINGVKKLMFKKPASDDVVIKVTSPDGGKKLVLPF